MSQKGHLLQKILMHVKSNLHDFHVTCQLLGFAAMGQNITNKFGEAKNSLVFEVVLITCNVLSCPVTHAKSAKL